MSERHIRIIGLVASALGILLLASLTPALTRLVAERPLSDLWAYYLAGERLNRGAPLYPADLDVNASEFYRYPPLLAIVFRPLALLPFPVVGVMWAAVNLAALLLTIRRLGFRQQTAAGLAILSFPIAWSLALGQAQVLVTWLLVVGNPLAVALAGQIKIFPALVALFWLGRRDWRSVRSFVAWSAALVVLQVLLEVRGSLDFLGTLTLEQVGPIVNLSPYGISREAWLVFVVALAGAALVLAPTRFGWAAAVLAASVSTPRLISYWFMSLLAGFRPQEEADRGSSLGRWLR